MNVCLEGTGANASTEMSHRPGTFLGTFASGGSMNRRGFLLGILAVGTAGLVPMNVIAQEGRRGQPNPCGPGEGRGPRGGGDGGRRGEGGGRRGEDRKSTRLNSSHSQISYAVFCLKKNSINRNIH